MPIQTVNNVAFNYELLGNPSHNPPLVLIPGYACDINFWRPVADVMADKHQVLIFDNQGIGQTKDDGQALNIDNMAINIKSLIDKLQLMKPIIAGFAMGGILAQKIAANFPSEITQLILLNSVMRFSVKARNMGEKLCILRESNQLDDYIYLLYEIVFGDAFKSKCSKEAFHELFLPTLTNSQKAEDQRRQIELFKTCDSTPWVKNIKTPTIVVSSTEDQFVTPDECQALATAIAEQGTNVEYFIIEKSGHSTIVEQPDKIIELFKQKCI